MAPTWALRHDAFGLPLLPLLLHPLAAHAATTPAIAAATHAVGFMNEIDMSSYLRAHGRRRVREGATSNKRTVTTFLQRERRACPPERRGLKRATVGVFGIVDRLTSQ